MSKKYPYLFYYIKYDRYCQLIENFSNYFFKGYWVEALTFSLDGYIINTQYEHMFVFLEIQYNG